MLDHIIMDHLVGMFRLFRFLLVEITMLFLITGIIILLVEITMLFRGIIMWSHIAELTVFLLMELHLGFIITKVLV